MGVEGIVTAEPEAGTSFEELLAPLLRADFFLTDGHGLVTRWGARPARAFAREAEDVIGRPAFDAVVRGADAWKQHLGGEGRRPDSRVACTAIGEGFAGGAAGAAGAPQREPGDEPATGGGGR